MGTSHSVWVCGGVHEHGPCVRAPGNGGEEMLTWTLSSLTVVSGVSLRRRPSLRTCRKRFDWRILPTLREPYVSSGDERRMGER